MAGRVEHDTVAFVLPRPVEHLGGGAAIAHVTELRLHLRTHIGRWAKKNADPLVRNVIDSIETGKRVVPVKYFSLIKEREQRYGP